MAEKKFSEINMVYLIQVLIICICLQNIISSRKQRIKKFILTPRGDRSGRAEGEADQGLRAREAGAGGRGEGAARRPGESFGMAKKRVAKMCSNRVPISAAPI